jgi:hypothetical protein
VAGQNFWRLFGEGEGEGEGEGGGVGKLPELWRGEGPSVITAISPVRHPLFSRPKAPRPQGPKAPGSQTSKRALRSANCRHTPKHCVKVSPNRSSEVPESR